MLAAAIPAKAPEAPRNACANRRFRLDSRYVDRLGWRGGGGGVRTPTAVGGREKAEPQPASTSLTYRAVLAAGRDRTTREYLVALLSEMTGNVTQAAERAGVERETFHRLLKRHGIRAEDFRTRT